MTKSNGIKSLKQAAKLLNKHAPDGESLAYINPEEAKVLRSRGGTGIQTLAGVPSYWSWDWLTGDTGLIQKGKDLVTNIGSSIFDRYKDQPAVYKDNKLVERAQSGLGNLARDAFSVWGALKAKKDQEGLNEAEMAQFNKLNEQLSAAKTEFDVSTDFGTQLKAPQNVPETIEDIASYTDVTLPTMKTTAVAEGGRIGYNLGGIGAMDPRIGYAQGMGPMGRQMGPEVSESLEFVDKIYSPDAKNLASSLYYPETFEEATIGDKYGVGELREGQEYTTESLNLANKMLDVKQERLLKLENFAQERGISQNEFKKMLNYFMERHGEDMGMNAMASHLGVFDDWEGERTDYENMDPRVMNPNYLKRNKFNNPLPDMPLDYAHGGRIGAQEGGIMPLLDMGGMEKDYRQDGGFVPIGRREKADDVPARLSKNEFVFTADAVRAAGGGDIDQGAQRMYNVMKNLEAGGDISEQSQGKA